MTIPDERAIAVRAATDEDRSAAAAFISPATARGRASLALLRLGQGLLWVAVEGGEGNGVAGESEQGEEKLVGLLLATAQIDAETERLVGYIQELLVHPAYRRLGAAMHLLDAAERFFLAEHGFAEVYLATSPDNEAALSLYRSRGYVVSQVRLTKTHST